MLLWIISAPLLAAQYGSQPDHLVHLDYLGCRLGGRLLLRSDRRFAVDTLHSNPANKGKVLIQRCLALYAPSQLFRRCNPVVGLLPDRSVSRRLVDDLQPDPDDPVCCCAFPEWRCWRKQWRQTRIQGIHRNHQRVHSLVPPEEESVNLHNPADRIPRHALARLTACQLCGSSTTTVNGES